MFAGEELGATSRSWRERGLWRTAWFDRVLDALTDCDLVFADPDNGLCADGEFRGDKRKNHKRLPLREALALAGGRTAVIYHHNTRYRGGHKEEIKH